MSLPLLLGVIGSVIIWTVQPINNYLLNNAFICDNYLPELVIGLVLLTVLIINPIIRLIKPNSILTMRQLALVFAMLLVAAAPTQILRIIPHSLARGNYEAAGDKQLSTIYEQMNLPPSLYIEPVQFGSQMPVTGKFITRLDSGETVPWRHWVAPFLSWGTMIISCWLLMAGMGLIVFPQWRENERLAFPLLMVWQKLIETPEAGKQLPPLFGNGLFWTGFLAVWALHFFNGLSYHTGGDFPQFPMGWSLWHVFSEGLWRFLSWSTKSVTLSFTMIGMAYFMPNRVGFSLWFTYIIYECYRMIGYEYMAPFHFETVNEHRNGAFIGVALVVLWLGRSHWFKVLTAVFQSVKSDEDKRNRTAGRLFLWGCCLLMLWQLWAGVQFGWAIVFLVMVFFTSLIIARIVAETGIPFIANYFGTMEVMRLAPVKWLISRTIYLGGFIDFIITGSASRVSAAVVCIHGFGIDKDIRPRQQVRLMYLFMMILILGFVICGIVHLVMTYHHPGSLDGSKTPLVAYGSSRIKSVHNYLAAWHRNSWTGKPYAEIAHMVFGCLMGGFLQIACLISPYWPIHPVGLLMAGTYFLGKVWVSVFVGWCLKMMIIVFGGARTYRTAQSLFLGFILGEITAAIFWTTVPVVLIAMGWDPADVGHIIIIPQ